MRRALAIAGVAAVVVLIAVLAFLFWPAPAPPAVAALAPTPELVARGAYVATAADCAACHTTRQRGAFAGGRAFNLPFGTIYSPNITPDRETGIGAWSDAEFVRALRDGVGREGEELYPAFPYTSYHRMREADALAIKAYLFSLPPVRSENRTNALAFPFNQRPLMRFWKLLFMPRRSFEGDAAQTPEWNRGAYLVTALGHCGECHTPRNLLYGFSGRPLSGETMQGWTAWNITSDPQHGVGGWSVDELAGYLGHGFAPGHGAALGPMQEAVAYSLSKLTPGDLRSIAVYLKSTKPSGAGPEIDPKPATLARSSLMQPGPGEPLGKGQGRQVFEGACASCHAWNGEGQQTPLAALGGLRSVADGKGTNVVQAILRGGSVSTPQGHGFMPSFAADYSDAEIAAAANYVIGHFGGKTGEVKPADVAKARRQ